MRPSVFVSHASEDKDAIARPLALALRDRGFDVWFDEFVLRVGDSLLRSIDSGLRACDFGVVVLSKAFFAKQWPQRELSGLIAQEDSDAPRILPIWHELSVSEIMELSPILADRLAASSAEGVDSLVDRIVTAVRPRPAHFQELASSQFILPFTISGEKLFLLAEEFFSKQHGVPIGNPSRLEIFFYEDLSGVDDRTSKFSVSESVVRSIRTTDVIALLSGQPFVPRGYSVVRLGVDDELLWSLDESHEERQFGLRELPHIEFTAAIDQQYVRDDELLSFATALAKYEDRLRHDTQGDLWRGRNSPGRCVVRRLARQGKLNSLADLVRVDWHFSYMTARPSADYRAFCLAEAIVMELDGGSVGVESPIVATLLGPESPLNDYWKTRLKAKLRGEPMWVDDDLVKELAKRNQPQIEAEGSQGSVSRETAQDPGLHSS